MKDRRYRSSVTRLALAAVVAHAAVLVAHSAAHEILGVEATPAQLVFIVAVIIVAPLVAGLLLWKRKEKAGALLLSCAMIGSLVFGVYYHFVADTTDHVSHVARMSPAGWSVVFQATAFLLALIEAFGAWAGWSVLKRSSYQNSRD
jgi:cytochrome bd-type quinol oxidase subunit 2